MSLTIYPCVWHHQTAAEAAMFYQSVFPESVVTESNPVAVMIKIGGNPLLLLNGGDRFTPNPSISFFFYARSAEEAREIFAKLSVNGKVLMPFQSYAWAAQYGWVQDQYNTSWQVVWDEPYPQNGTITPCLLFGNSEQGKARDAINFYSSIFHHHQVLQLEPYPEDGSPAAGQIMFAQIALENNPLIFMDSGTPQEFIFNEGVSLVLECNNQQEIDHFWDNFTSRGEESMCGWCKDQFNVSWQVIPKHFTSLIQSPEAVAAFMKMKKIEVEKLKMEI